MLAGTLQKTRDILGGRNIVFFICSLQVANKAAVLLAWNHSLGILCL